jgi:transcriptional regulator with GAF, ATPase, and Fis domain
MQGVLMMEKYQLTRSHTILHRAIELFSQPLLSHQIAKYAYEIFSEMLSLKEKALFLSSEDGFSLVQQQGYDIPAWVVSQTSQLKELPVLHAGFVRHHWGRWFAQDWIDAFQPALVIPLVMKQKLFGWIVAKGTISGTFDEEKMQLAHTLLYLVQSALQSSEQQHELEQLQQQFNKNLYTLMGLQTYTTSLLTQTSLDDLYERAVDAFGELARSTITSLAVWDELRDRLVVVAYKDNSYRHKQYGEFFLQQEDMSKFTGRLYEFGKDNEYLDQIFTSSRDFSLLSAKYIILLGKENLVGFVTLSDSPVIEQDENFFETIQLLASITYLAIMQARRWEEVILQRDINHRKVQALSTLHLLTSNLGQCCDLDELMTLIAHTLTLYAKVNRMFLVLQTHEHFEVKSSLGMKPDLEISTEVMDKWIPALDSTICEYTSEGANKWLENLDIAPDTDTNCLIVVPFWRHRIKENWDLDQQSQSADFLGCLCIMGVQGGLSEEVYMVIDTIAHNLQPFLLFYLAA